MSDGRRLEKEIKLNATPEQVWEVISTGPGMSAWFVPHEIEPGEGGRTQADFGSGNISDGSVLAWEPGRRVVYGGGDGSPAVLEFLIEGRDGGSTVLRFVQSGFDGDDWESEYENFSEGWDLFFHNMSQYFDHFAGRPVSNVAVLNFTELDREAVWARLNRALGVPDGVAVGDQVTFKPTGAPEVSGVVDLRQRGLLGVLADDGLYRFMGEGADKYGYVTATHYIYRELDRTELTAAWQAWLDRVLAE
jgi:uncharacterized protein YndB with AHSA1/START domain